MCFPGREGGREGGAVLDVISQHLPLVNRHTGVKILPCPKLRLRAVKTLPSRKLRKIIIIMRCKKRYLSHKDSLIFDNRPHLKQLN